MSQLLFDFLNNETSQNDKTIEMFRENFSHDSKAPEIERKILEVKYRDLLIETNKFNRKLVSFQANKTEVLHNWMKYREGFSAELVKILLDEFGLTNNDVVLDPFAGSCTTLIVAKLMGINAIGIELLPHCHLAWEGKRRAYVYDIEELKAIREKFTHQTYLPLEKRFPHLNITHSAFPIETEREVLFFSAWIEQLSCSEDAKILLHMIIMSILEEISFTRKDGQYLRWDGRAEKIIQRNINRKEKGKEPIKGIDKGKLPNFREAFLRKLDTIIKDVKELQKEPVNSSSQELVKGNSLNILPTFSDNSISAVITSPPYANRYDYTRTYALELAYLEVKKEIFNLRQNQLSCTVENKSKVDDLEKYYKSLGKINDFHKITSVVENNKVLHEIIQALKIRQEMGEINNKGVISMLDQYFSELTFIYAELFRVCKPGAHVAFVNDNVRYAGEAIPVDLLSTNLAEQVGFKPIVVYVLPQRKGNSSQQMAKYGRDEMRKSITIWEKP